MWSINERPTERGSRLRVQNSRPAAVRLLLYTILVLGLIYLLSQGLHLLYAERRAGPAPILSLGVAIGLVGLACRTAFAEWLASADVEHDTLPQNGTGQPHTRLLVLLIQSGGGPLVMESAPSAIRCTDEPKGVYLTVTSLSRIDCAVTKAVELSRRLQYPLTVVVGPPAAPGAFFLRLHVQRMANLFAAISLKLEPTSTPFFRAHCLPRGTALVDHLSAVSVTSVIVLPSRRWGANADRQLAERLRRNGLVVCDDL